MKKIVTVSFEVEVEVDETKFTEEFMAEFRESMYPFKTIDDHLKHLAQLEARGILFPKFVEGYGPAAEFGIKTGVVDSSMEIR